MVFCAVLVATLAIMDWPPPDATPLHAVQGMAVSITHSEFRRSAGRFSSTRAIAPR